MTKIATLAAPEVRKITNSGIDSDNNFVNI